MEIIFKDDRELMNKKKAMGGTELMMENLKKRIKPTLFEGVNLITDHFIDELEKNDGKYKLLWFHDLAEDPKYQFLKQQKYIDRTKNFIFVSDWQMQNFTSHYNLPAEKCLVIKNAIKPIPEHQKEKSEKINFIYTSTPHRGLNILYEAIKILSNERSDFHVDIFSSFEIYGWMEQERKSKSFFNELNNHPNIISHGYQSNEVVRRALEKAHVFVYPSNYIETYCLSMVEAMSAKCYCIVPNLGALIETGSQFPLMYPYIKDPRQHAGQVASYMNMIIDSYWNDSIQKIMELQKIHTDIFHSWSTAKLKWETLFSTMNNLEI